MGEAALFSSAAGFSGRFADQIVKELHEALAVTVRLPQIAERLKADGATAVADLPEHFAAFLADELKHWKEIVDDLRVR